MKLTSSQESILPNFFFSVFFFFGIKLGHFAINNFFLYVTKMQANQQKMEKFFVSEEIKFGRIDSRWNILWKKIVFSSLLLSLKPKLKGKKRFVLWMLIWKKVNVDLVDPTKLFFFGNEEFFCFSLVSLRFCYIPKKIIDSKIT